MIKNLLKKAAANNIPKSKKMKAKEVILIIQLVSQIKHSKKQYLKLLKMVINYIYPSLRRVVKILNYRLVNYPKQTKFNLPNLEWL